MCVDTIENLLSFEAKMREYNKLITNVKAHGRTIMWQSLQGSLSYTQYDHEEIIVGCFSDQYPWIHH